VRIAIAITFITMPISNFILGLDSRFIVNGDTTATEAVQGDSVVFEILLDNIGDEVRLFFSFDLDSSLTFNQNDIIALGRSISDGAQHVIPILPNLSTEFDGIIQLLFHPFYMKPGILMLTCMKDTSTIISSAIPVIANPDPPHTISGSVSLEGISPPDERLSGILVWAAMAEFMSPLGMGEVTDSFGNFSFNCMDYDTGIAIIPNTEIPGFTKPDYQWIELSAEGETTNVNFEYSQADCHIFGTSCLSGGDSIPSISFFNLQKRDGQYVDRFYSFKSSEYIFSVNPGRYKLELVRDVLPKGYFSPPEHEFNISAGDSIQIDVISQTCTDSIYGYVTESGGIPSRSYMIMAETDQNQSAIDFTDENGFYSIYVPYSTIPYSIEFCNDLMETPLDEGFVISGGNTREAYCGDTVNFDIIPSSQTISGEITADPSIDHDMNWMFFVVALYDTNWNRLSSTYIDDNSYTLYCEPGVYNIEFDGISGYLSYPNCYSNIEVDPGASITGKDFTIHETNCLVKIILDSTNPDSIAEQYYKIENGPWDDCISSGTCLYPGDTLFTVGLPEGNWRVFPPKVHGHGCLENSIIFYVGPTDSTGEITFHYHEGICTWIAGDLTIGISGSPISDDVYIVIDDLDRGFRDSVFTEDGYFEYGTFPGRYQIRTSYSLLDHEPPWLMPPYWISSYFIVEPEFADTSIKNMYIYPADTLAWLIVNENDDFPTRYYKFRAKSNEMGLMIRHTDAMGKLEMPLANGPGTYTLYFASEDTPPPEGFFIEGRDYWNLELGDSIFVNITPYENYIAGYISTESSLPLGVELEDFTIHAQNDSVTLSSSRSRNYGEYYKSVPPGNWDVWIEGPGNMMSKPFKYQRITMHTSDIHDIDFVVNEISCRVQATITGIPLDSIPQTVANCYGDSLYPYCYYLLAEIDSGETQYDFNVCDGNWIFSPPVISGYHSRDTIVTIYDSDTLIEIDFPYEIGEGLRETQKPLDWGVRNFPNPFNSTVNIEYSIPAKSNININIYNILGENIKSLFSGIRSPGIYSLKWNGKDDKGNNCPTGIYYCRVDLNNNSYFKKVLLLR